MKLEDALKGASPLTALADDPNIIYHVGAVAQDGNPDFIRIYPQPQNSFKYLRMKKSDVVGELTEIPEEQLRDSGIISKVGFAAARAVKVYHVPCRRGAEAQVVQIMTATLGKQYPPGFLHPIRRPGGPMQQASASPGQQPHGCGCGGGTGKPGGGTQQGGPADTYYGYCTFCGACVSGCCWCNDFTGCACDSCPC